MRWTRSIIFSHSIDKGYSGLRSPLSSILSASYSTIKATPHKVYLSASDEVARDFTPSSLLDSIVKIRNDLQHTDKFRSEISALTSLTQKDKQLLIQLSTEQKKFSDLASLKKWSAKQNSNTERSDNEALSQLKTKIPTLIKEIITLRSGKQLMTELSISKDEAKVLVGI